MLQNRRHLTTLLNRLHVDWDRVSVYDDGFKDEALFIRENDLGWRVFYMEKGKESSTTHFESEWQACRYFLGSICAEPNYFLSAGNPIEFLDE